MAPIPPTMGLRGHGGWRVPLLLTFLGLAACGGPEPVPLPVQDEVALLVEDDFLAEQGCARLGSLAVKGELSIAGVLGYCRISVKTDGSVRSLCEKVPGKKARSVTLTYLGEDAEGPLELVELEDTVDLTAETRSRVPLDFTTKTRRLLQDADGDGRSNLEELCAGEDPRRP
jgi:hypothetical protein